MQNFSPTTKTAAAALATGTILATILLAAEFLFSIAYPSYRPIWDTREIAAILIIGSLLALTYHKKIAITIGGMLFLLQASSFLYFAYFGAFYGPSDIHLLFLDHEEAITSALGELKHLLPALLISLTTALIFFFAYHRTYDTVPKLRIASVLLPLAIFSPIIEANRQDNSQKFEPDSASLALKNAVYANAFVLGHDILNKQENQNPKIYKPYNTEPIPMPGNYHVVFLIGESLTYAHMGIFGYKRDTTPNLQKLLDSNQLVIRPAISSAVSTRVSVPMILNTQYEPDNLAHISHRETPLFKLAKRNGFQTAFISTQKMDGISSALSGSDIDYWIEARNMTPYQGNYDNRLINALRDLPLSWSNPAFIVLNQRSAHSPYANNYPREWSYYSSSHPTSRHEQAINEYDDAVRYIDKNVRDILDFIYTKSSIPVLFFMTSDHGEKLGEDGKYGHNTLDFTTASVPFIFYHAHNTPPEILDRTKSLPCPVTHYEVAKLIAETLGFLIKNPNEIDEVFFINGTDIMGRAGFMIYHKSDTPQQTTCSSLGLS